MGFLIELKTLKLNLLFQKTHHKQDTWVRGWEETPILIVYHPYPLVLENVQLFLHLEWVNVKLEKEVAGIYFKKIV